MSTTAGTGPERRRSRSRSIVVDDACQPKRYERLGDSLIGGTAPEILDSPHPVLDHMLLHEHYLDLTYVFVMHPELVPPGIETLPPLDEVEVSEMSVAYSRVLPAVRLADWEAEATGLPRDTECARREQGTFVSPALHVQRWSIDAEGRQPFELLRAQGFTPESSTSTHVFLQIVRNYASDRSVVGDHLRAMFHEWALRDARVLESVQRQLGQEVEPRRDLNVKADRAAIRARRVAQAMVEEELARITTRPALA